MVALLIGLVLVVFAVYTLLPVAWAPGWWGEMLEFLKGGIPIVAVLIGLVSFFVGIADIKDKIEARKEEEEERLETERAGNRDTGGGGDAGSG